MAKSRAQIQAPYRERQKAKLGKQWYTNEALRVNKYYVPTSQLSKTQQTERRLKVKDRVRRYRATVKAAKVRLEEEHHNQQHHHQQQEQQQDHLDDSAISDLSADDTPQPPLRIKMCFRKRNRQRKGLRRAQRNIENLQLQIQKLKKEKKTLLKRCERARKSSAIRSTPNSKTRKELKQAGLDSNIVPTNVKKQILFKNVLIDEIRAASETSGQVDHKRTLCNIISGKIMKKYRLIALLSKETGIPRESLRNATSKSTAAHKTKRRKWINLHKEVVAFFERDDNSRMLPGKKDALKTPGESRKRQIRCLNDYMKNLYLKYTTESVGNRRVSYATFKRIRQRNPHLKLVKFTAKSNSLCQKHQNLALKLEPLKDRGLIKSSNPEDLVKNHDDHEISRITQELCNVGEKNIKYEEWKRVEKEGTTIKKTKLVTVIEGTDTFTSKFMKEISEFRQHVFRMKAQWEGIRKCKESLSMGECVVQMDFAQNYTCVPFEEVQSGFWAQETVTLHPMLVYFNDDEGKLVHQSFMAISDSHAHNANSIYAILKELLPKLHECVGGLTTVRYWTDSPTSQYRNKTIMAIVARHLNIFGVKASWDYFEAGHGKGPCDGLGGTAKRLADEAVKRGSVKIQDAHDFFAWAIQEREQSAIKYFFVSKEQVKKSEMELKEKFDNLKPVQGTKKIHAVKNTTDTTIIIVRDTSCYCGGCHVEDNMCNGWRKHTFSKQGSNETTSGTGKSMYEVDDFVAAVYDGEWFIGQIKDLDDDDANINFLTHGSKINPLVYKWPTSTDQLDVSYDNILCKVNLGTKCSGRLFVIDEDERDKILSFFAIA